jgi:4-diphosphocytidyl-2-C-methyl-D-erythritol kinase
MVRAQTRSARVKALAKLNLTLEVLHKRSDGFHELRTVFQSISLHDELQLEWTPGRKTRVEVTSRPEIEDNLALRAAKALLEQSDASGSLHINLKKRIPMGAGLGGGSSDAAAVLLALPVLTGRAVAFDRLWQLATLLGSDVPYFLAGGTALGLGRGTEIYPVRNADARHVLVIAPGIHVSTGEAYTDLGHSLTPSPVSPKMGSSQSLVLSLDAGSSKVDWIDFCSNDFESAVFKRYPKLVSVKQELRKAGARAALMSGSGSAIFGVFAGSEAARRAASRFPLDAVYPATFVSQSRYRSLWRRDLAEHIKDLTWPPQSRYSR